jgi:hypothetical protein
MGTMSESVEEFLARGGKINECSEEATANVRRTVAERNFAMYEQSKIDKEVKKKLNER